MAAVSDPSVTPSPLRKGGCYSTTAGHTVCWQGLGTDMYALALRQVNNKPNFATTLFLTCGGRWEAYGPADRQSLEALISAFCAER